MQCFRVSVVSTRGVMRKQQYFRLYDKSNLISSVGVLNQPPTARVVVHDVLARFGPELVLLGLGDVCSP